MITYHYKTFGDDMLMYRTARGITRHELARELTISAATINTIETKQPHNINIVTLLIILNKLDWDLNNYIK